MKFMMNGAVTIATLDGNIEIRDEVGDDNINLGMKDYEVLNYYKMVVILQGHVQK